MKQRPTRSRTRITALALMLLVSHVSAPRADAFGGLLSGIAGIAGKAFGFAQRIAPLATSVLGTVGGILGQFPGTQQAAQWLGFAQGVTGATASGNPGAILAASLQSIPLAQQQAAQNAVLQQQGGQGVVQNVPGMTGLTGTQNQVAVSQGGPRATQGAATQQGNSGLATAPIPGQNIS